MIALLPAYHETIVLSGQATITRKQLSLAISDKAFRQPNEKLLFFNGWIRENKFIISLRGQRINYFLPLVIGQIESAPSGCILFVDYKLFPTTRALMIVWTFLLLLGSMISVYYFKNALMPLGAAGLIALIHSVAWLNFKLQLRLTRDALHHTITQEIAS